MFVRYLLRRAMHFVVLLAVLSALSFLLVRLVPGGFFDDLRLNPQISPETVETLRARYAMDRPFAAQYARWLASVWTGDFGTSLAYQRPAAQLIWPRARNTLLLTTLTLAITWIIALPLALACASRPGGLLERTSATACSILLAVPELIAALLLLYCAARTGILPVVGSIIPPLIVLIAGAFPIVYRHTYSAAQEAAEAPYINAARAHGISGTRLWLRFILLAAANPLISLFGVSIGALASASLLAELLLNWPGLGPLFLDAISARDIDVVIGVVLISAGFLAAGNLAADLLLYACDPRIRTESR